MIIVHILCKDKGKSIQNLKQEKQNKYLKPINQTKKLKTVCKIKFKKCEPVSLTHLLF